MNGIVFITFHLEGRELPLRLDGIMGMRRLPSPAIRWCVITIAGEYDVDEDWDYLKGQIRRVEQAAEDALREIALTNRVTRKFNGQGN